MAAVASPSLVLSELLFRGHFIGSGRRDNGQFRNQADLAHQFNLSRARVTQILAILRLPHPVVDYLASLFHEDRAKYNERELRRILSLPTEDEQVKAFEELRMRLSVEVPTLVTFHVFLHRDIARSARLRPTQPLSPPTSSSLLAAARNRKTTIDAEGSTRHAA